MTSSLIDSNVLIDVFQNDPSWYVWSRDAIARARGDGEVVVNPVVAAEVATEFSSIEKWSRLLTSGLWTTEGLPWRAAYLAGAAHRAYRQRGGQRERTLPDFLVGAHAEVRGYRIVTRDPRRYRAYFPAVDVIAPDTHP